MYPPLFTRILPEGSSTGAKIPEAQIMFQNFWHILNKLADNGPEKTEAMRRLQEASMWFSRAIAASAWHLANPEAKKMRTPEFKSKPQNAPDWKNANSVKYKVKQAPELPKEPEEQYGEFNIGLPAKHAVEAARVNAKNQELYKQNLAKQTAPVVTLKRSKLNAEPKP